MPTNEEFMAQSVKKGENTPFWGLKRKMAVTTKISTLHPNVICQTCVKDSLSFNVNEYINNKGQIIKP